MTALYPWIVFVHVLAAFGFVLAHGTSALVAFAVRGERDPKRIAALLDLSDARLGLMYGSLFILVVAGVVAGVTGHWFAQRWIWAALALLVVVAMAMYGYAVPYYTWVRGAIGLPSRDPRLVAAAPVPPAELDALLRTGRPGGIAAVGVVGLAVLVWLMVFKPF